MKKGSRARGFDAVRRAGLSLPGVEESTCYGAPALKLRGRLLACMAINKSAEPNTLVVCLPFDQRDALIDEEPGTYYLKDHYLNYPSVLVRLSRIRLDALRALLGEAWRFADQLPKRRVVTRTFKPAR